MSRIDEMIARLCPNGVEYKKLGEMLDYEQPGKYIVSSTDYDDSYPTPVLTAGQSFILGYTDDSEGIYDASKDNPVVLIDDFTTANRWIDFPFKVKSSAAKLLTSKDETQFSLRYLFYLLQMNRYEPMAHSRQWIGTFSQIEVPVPPLDIQHEIVRILGSFVELEAELEARRIQYTYYRDQLLSRENLEIMASTTIGLRPLSDVLEMKAGIHIPASKIHSRQTDESPYPCYGGNGLRGYVASPNQNGDKILIGRQGALCGNICAASGHFYATEHAIVSTCSNELLPRYAFHMLTNANLNQYKSQGAQPGLAVGNLKQVEFPIPPLPVQQRVVDILDRFDALTSSLTDGLPAEIEARRRQYEYYRDRLLDFPRKEADS